MPQNKNASIRYRILDKLFRHDPGYTMKDLQIRVSEALTELTEAKTPVSVSTWTLRGDIRHMNSAEGWSAGIVCERGRYRYARSGFSIEKVNLTTKERGAIREALAVLRQFEGLPQASALGALLERLEGPDRGFNPNLVQFETNPQAQGLSWLRPLYEAAAAGQALQVRYKPFGVAEQQLVFHPYLLKEFRNRWFAFGWHDVKDTIWNLALDRIQDLRPSIRPFRPNTDWDPVAYFHDVVGVTRYADAQPEEVVFDAFGACADYIASKPIHHSQQLLHQTETSATFRLFVVRNPELTAELLRWGKEVRIYD